MDRGMEKGGIVIEKVPSPCMEEAEQARAIVKEKRSFSEQVFPERAAGSRFESHEREKIRSPRKVSHKH